MRAQRRIISHRDSRYGATEGMTRDPTERVCLRANAWIRGSLLLVLAALPGIAQGAEGVHWTILGPNSVAFYWRGPETTIYFQGAGPYVWRVIAHTPDPSPEPVGEDHREAILQWLLPNTLYRYRIGDGPEHTFRTPPKPGTSGFWFAAQADIGSSAVYSTITATQEQIAADEPTVPGEDRPRFVLAVGDLTYGDQRSALDVPTHFNDVQAWSLDAAYMPSWGNHEWQCLSSFSCNRPDNLNNYEGRFVLPNTQSISGASTAMGNGPADDWGWFDYGNTRFISMPALDMPGARAEWSSAVAPIMAEAQASPRLVFIVVYGHFPAWSTGSDHGDDPSLQADLVSLRTSFPKFVLSMHGHSHHYERWTSAETGGLVSLVLGGGGSACGGMRSSKASGSLVRSNELHHLKIQVHSDRIEGWAVCGPLGGSGCTHGCAPGEILDHWMINAAGPLSTDGPPAPPSVIEDAFYDVAGRRVQQPLRSGIYFRVRGNVRQVIIVR